MSKVAENLKEEVTITSPLIDTHAHLDDVKYDDDRAEMIKRAWDSGLGHIITIGCWNGDSGFGRVPEIVAENENVVCALGVHPHDAKDVVDDSPFDEIRKHVKNLDKVVAIGELGLDYHYTNSPIEKQKEVFIAQIELAKELNLPIIVHTRDAEDDTIEILKKYEAHKVCGVIHCFSGSDKLAQACLEMGFFISFSGILTFPKAGDLREVAKRVPIERSLVETDCPYLAPVPNRGRRNEPSFVVETAKTLADVKGLTVDDVARITTVNAKNLFGLGDEETEEVKIAYPIRDSLYLNITNRCSIFCTFCGKFSSYTVKGHNLKLRQEPDFNEIIKSAEAFDLSKYSEIVFCGYGEPTVRLDILKEVGKYFKDKGFKIRINTDGVANLYHKRNIVPELDFVDVYSVSLNAQDSETYQKIIKSSYKDDAFPAILEFLKLAKESGATVIATVVATPEVDVDACKAIADGLGIEFRSREFNVLG